jgi:hypothetical protein
MSLLVLSFNVLKAGSAGRLTYRYPPMAKPVAPPATPHTNRYHSSAAGTGMDLSNIPGMYYAIGIDVSEGGAALSRCSNEDAYASAVKYVEWQHTSQAANTP